MPFRILIADDAVTARKTLRELLGKHGYDVSAEAENGLEAVARALELKPDVVSLDLGMPNLDGLSAARRISEVMPKTAIILHTLHDVPQLELEAEKNGISCVVSKTATIRILSFLERMRKSGDASRTGARKSSGSISGSSYTARENFRARKIEEE